MKAIAINGSARKDGNTAILVNQVLNKLNDNGIKTEFIQLAGQIIQPCKACWACGGKGNCIHKQDCFQEIFEKVKKADIIILASPSYSANVSANMQAFIERTAVICDMNPGLLDHKIGASIAVARRAGAIQALDTMNHFFLNHNMIVVGSSYWNLGYGQLPGDVTQDGEAITTMTNLADNILYLTQSLSK